MMFTVFDARSYGKNILQTSQILTAQENFSASLDSDVLLSSLLGKERSWLLAHPDADVSAIQSSFKNLIEKRCSGIPVAYLTGKKDFFQSSFYVTPAVLIPKPDTELLVEQTLEAIRERSNSSPLSLLEPCTGSGCVVISVLKELEKIGITNITTSAFDISNEALAVAKKNAENLLSPKMRDLLSFFRFNLQESFSRLGTAYDIIFSNPPYVPTEMARLLLQDGRKEPFIALDGGAEGLDFIQALANNSYVVLKRNGMLLSEVDEYHANQAADILIKAGFSSVTIHKDFNLQDRLVTGIKV
ncbi:peptide chain release factor N(5)-glutamine methyltransferase [Treponema phagedenis]|uniref:peptide chain release factor N(5)-glutamine methyltransferase n=1 Tax=Treponema phagedenis TaxID=162 RepID=UPI0001F638FF|nr:peptide chain release factor N(5)-glutamine methyltransferase [Treponema phagedenis]EFW36536.1 protein-(glutamine-N5) methyltransferase, release factor-specific [Treponema phagedenis F0421]